MIDGVPQESGERQPGRWVDQEGAPSVPQPTSPPQAGAVYPQQTAPHQPAQQQAGQPWTGQDHQAAYPAGQPYQYPDTAQPTQQWSPAPGQPAWSAEPSSGSPAWSGMPSSGPPTSGGPAQSWPSSQPHTDPWGGPYPLDTDRGPDSRRIVPSPPRKSRGLIIGLVAGIVVAALAAGTGGYLVGHSGASPDPAPTGAAPNDPNALPAYEASQFTLNRAKLEGALSPLAGPWLTTVGACAADGDKDGPKLGVDETKHVFCRYSAVSLHFIVFKSVEQKDSARAYRAELNLTNDGVAPGMEPASRKSDGASGAKGKYVEYAYRDGSGRALCGIWWDRDDDANGALIMETLCEEGLGGKWDPLRDLWRRHS